MRFEPVRVFYMAQSIQGIYILLFWNIDLGILFVKANLSAFLSFRSNHKIIIREY